MSLVFRRQSSRIPYLSASHAVLLGPRQSSRVDPVLGEILETRPDSRHRIAAAFWPQVSLPTILRARVDPVPTAVPGKRRARSIATRVSVNIPRLTRSRFAPALRLAFRRVCRLTQPRRPSTAQTRESARDKRAHAQPTDPIPPTRGERYARSSRHVGDKHRLAPFRRDPTRNHRPVPVADDRVARVLGLHHGGSGLERAEDAEEVVLGRALGTIRRRHENELAALRTAPARPRAASWRRGGRG